MSQKKKLQNKITKELAQATEEKFKAWDEVRELNLLEGTPENISYTMGLLSDPTIYAYAFFRDKTGNPLKLYPYQDLVANDNSPRVYFSASNQIGKSLLAEIKSLHIALTQPGKTVVIVSKTLDQAKDRLKEIKDFLNSSILDYKSQVGDSENKTEIYFKHFDGDKELKQSRILVIPCTDALLSYAVDYLVLDELPFYEDGKYFYYQVAQPRTYATKGGILVVGNPNGEQGIGWELWNDESFSKYSFYFLDCPTNTIEEYNRLKRTLPRDIFDSTVDSKFTSPKGGFISTEERRAMQEDRQNYIPILLQEQLYVFFDWGKARDRTIRVIGSPMGWGDVQGVKVFEMVEYPEGTPYSSIVEELERTVREIGTDKFAMVGWDNTGVGKGIEDFINRIENTGISCMPVEFSLQNKSRIYLLFKLLIEKNLRPNEYGIKMPFIDECDKQLAALRFSRTDRGYYKVHHENEDDRDDYPDALAGLCSLIIQPDNPPVTAVLINDMVRSEEEFDYTFKEEEWENANENEEAVEETNRDS